MFVAACGEETFCSSCSRQAPPLAQMAEQRAADIQGYYRALRAPVPVPLPPHPNSHSIHRLDHLDTLNDIAMLSHGNTIPASILGDWKAVLDATGSWATAEAIKALHTQYTTREEREFPGCTPDSPLECPFKVASREAERAWSLAKLEKEMRQLQACESIDARGIPQRGRIVVRTVPESDVRAGLAPEALRFQNEAIAADDIMKGEVLGVYSGVYSACARYPPHPTWVSCNYLCLVVSL
jgi:hypothetical protein